MDDWIVEFHDELRVPLLVGGGADVSDLLDRLIATLEERGVLSRYSLGTDPSTGGRRTRAGYGGWSTRTRSGGCVRRTARPN
jgi:hypothetical protein